MVQIDSEAVRQMLTEAYRCPTFDEFGKDTDSIPYLKERINEGLEKLIAREKLRGEI